MISIAPNQSEAEDTHKNCWLVVRTLGSTCELYKAHQKATALLLLEDLLRDTLENGPVPGTLSLVWYDSGGQQHLLSKVKIESML